VSTSGAAGTDELVALVGPVWSQGRTCEALSVSRAELADFRRAGGVLGLTTADGALVYPVSQFHRRGGTVEVRPSLVPFLTALRRFDPWAVAVLLHTPSPELHGATPLDWARGRGDLVALADYAKAVAREWAAGSF
jgi:hypothetical protein